MIKSEMKICKLNMPCNASILDLNQYLIKFYMDNYVTQEDLDERYQIFNEFKAKFSAAYPGKFRWRILRKIK